MKGNRKKERKMKEKAFLGNTNFNITLHHILIINTAVKSYMSISDFFM